MKEEELDYWRFIDVFIVEKEKEFEKYVREVINFEFELIKKYVYFMVKVVQEGVGGGRGLFFVGRGGIRLSYQVIDVIGVQFFCFKS